MEPDALTDDELLSLPNGHPMLGKLTSEEAQRRTTLQLGTPPGDARTRKDGNVIGLDRDRMSLNIANWASKLSPEWQKPAAMIASFPADVLASLVEMFSAPESVATMGAGPAMSAMGAVGSGAKAVPNMAIRGAAAVGDVVAPDVVGVVSPRLGRGLELAQRLRAKLNNPKAAAGAPPRLAGKAPTVEGALIDAMNDVRAGAPPQSVSLPGGGAVRATDPVPKVEPSGPRMGAYSSEPTPPASAARPASPSGAPPAAAPAAPARSTPRPPATESIRLTAPEREAFEACVAEGYDPADVMQAIVAERRAVQPSVASEASGAPGLSAAEAKEFQRLLSRGKTPEQAKAIIDQQRVFVANKGLPTSEEASRAIVERNTSGRWRD